VNKTFLIIIIVTLLSIGLASAALDDDLLHYWTFDSTTDDAYGSNDLTNTGATSVPAGGIIGGTYDYADSGDYMTGDSLASEINGLADFTINIWTKVISQSDISFVTSSNNGGGVHQFSIYWSAASLSVQSSSGSAGYSSVADDSQWYMITMVKDGTTLNTYINGTFENSDTCDATIPSNSNTFYVGRQTYLGSQGADGYIDEFGMWERALTTDEIEFLFAEGSPDSDQQYPFNEGEAEESDPFNITLKDEYTGQSVNDFSAYITIDKLIINGTYDLTGFIATAGGHWTRQPYNFTILYDSNYYALPEVCETEFLTSVAGETWATFKLSGALNKLSCYNGGGYTEILNTYVEGEDFTFLGTWGEIYTTTNGTISTNLYVNDTNDYNITVYSNDYFPHYYEDQSITTGLNATSHATEIKFITKEIISNNTLSNVTYYINGTANTTFILPVQDIWVLNATKTGYYDLEYLFNTSGRQNETITLTGMYNNILTVNITDVVTNETVGVNSYLNVYNSFYGYNFTYSNSNGSFNINLLQGNYSLTAWATDYAYAYDDIIINATTYNYTVGLYANNSLWVTAQDLDTGNPILNFSVNVYDINRSYVFNDNNTGTAKKEDIISGVYIVEITKSGYTTAQYPITITGGSHQNLVAYLQSGATETTFTVQDLISNGLLEGATSNQYKLINSSYVLISSQLTDITGRVQFSYVTGNEYKFVISLTDYDTRTFLLTPLFSTYTIRLTPTTTEDVDTSGGNWIYYISPNEFYNGEDTNYTISLSSGTGTLVNFSLDVYYSFVATRESETCVNAYGCSYDYNVVVGGSSYDDYIQVNYTVYETGRNPKTFSLKYYVIGAYNEYTLTSWTDEDATTGVGDLEKGFIATTILLIVIGAIATAASFVGAPPLTTSGITLTVLIIVLASVGFVPQYVAWVVGFGGLLMVIFGRGNY